MILMPDEVRQDLGITSPRNRIDIFLDGAAEPILSTTAPLSFDLHTSRWRTGLHVMRIEAYDGQGMKGTRTIDFSVRNGPGIAVAGIQEHDVLDGTIPVIVNAYGGTSVVDWQPSQAETPAPSPTWAWVLLLLVVAFGVFYGVQQWSPTRDFACTPTQRDIRRVRKCSRGSRRRGSACRPPIAGADRHRAGGIDNAVIDPDAPRRRAWRGAGLRQLRLLPPGDGPGFSRCVSTAGERPDCPDPGSDRSHQDRPQR